MENREEQPIFHQTSNKDWTRAEESLGPAWSDIDEGIEIVSEEATKEKENNA